jgi:hypothetical protein
MSIFAYQSPFARLKHPKRIRGRQGNFDSPQTDGSKGIAIAGEVKWVLF